MKGTLIVLQFLILGINSLYFKNFKQYNLEIFVIFTINGHNEI